VSSQVLSLGELTSAIPFGGGMFAFARLTMGNYVGHLVGCLQVLTSLM
jgi:amino acid transporter